MSAVFKWIWCLSVSLLFFLNNKSKLPTDIFHSMFFGLILIATYPLVQDEKDAVTVEYYLSLSRAHLITLYFLFLVFEGFFFLSFFIVTNLGYMKN